MAKDRRDSRERLFGQGFLANGLRLPGDYLIPPDWNRAGRALAAALRFGQKSRQVRELGGLELLRSHLDRAAADLKALSPPASKTAVNAYVLELGRWPFNPLEALEVALAGRSALNAAPREYLEHLPWPPQSAPGPAPRHINIVPLTTWTSWHSFTQEITRRRLLRTWAERAHSQYFKFVHIREWPNPVLFNQHLSAGIARLRSSSEVSRRLLDREVGTAAALASRYRFEAARWDLELADLLLEPEGSYFNASHPANFQFWYVIDAVARTLLKDSLTPFAISRAVAAAKATYWQPLRKGESIVGHARNVIEKLRRRTLPSRLRPSLKAMLEAYDPFPVLLEQLPQARDTWLPRLAPSEA